MSARDVVGLLRLGGGGTSVLIKIEGTLKKECNMEQIRAEIEDILRNCGLTVSSFQVAAKSGGEPGKKK